MATDGDGVRLRSSGHHAWLGATPEQIDARQPDLRADFSKQDLRLRHRDLERCLDLPGMIPTL